MNQWGKEHMPFVFLLDFELKKPMLSEEEVTRVSNIKNSARATRVLDRMKKRKGMGNSRMMD